VSYSSDLIFLFDDNLDGILDLDSSVDSIGEELTLG